MAFSEVQEPESAAPPSRSASRAGVHAEVTLATLSSLESGRGGRGGEDGKSGEGAGRAVCEWICQMRLSHLLRLS